jgi:hypothetical protein
MRTIYGVIAAVLMLAAVAAVQAADGNKGCSGCCSVRCPQCNYVCKFSAEKEDVPHTCYSVKCEPICIPRVVFPWQKRACCDGSCGCGGCCDTGGCDGRCGTPGCCMVNNGACLKMVKVLTKFEYTCPECSYKWTPVSKGCGGTCDGCDGCDVSGGGSSAPPQPEVPEAPAVDARYLFKKPIVERTTFVR